MGATDNTVMAIIFYLHYSCSFSVIILFPDEKKPVRVFLQIIMYL